MLTGRIARQGSRLVRWAAVESVQILPETSRAGQIRDRVEQRLGRNIGVVAAARRQLEYAFNAPRDHHVVALHPPRSVLGHSFAAPDRLVDRQTLNGGVPEGAA